MTAIEGMELYKRHRPNKWENLIGQAKVANSLRSAVVTDRIPTAYIFSGPRGCGKTSAAFLLAKSINCEKRLKNGDPCNECETCKGIESGSHLGFTYISTANVQGVENVRELVKQARLRQSVKKQVFILDEIHNLSKQAFDALLIPLEDVNMPSLFIFCTTEIAKVPETVLSRVQQRKFSLVSPEVMLPYLKRITQEESLDLTGEQLETAVRLGRGSVRDTLTQLENVISLEEESTTYGEDLFKALAARDVAAAMTVVATATADNINFRDLGEQMFEDLRDIMLVAVGVSRDIIGLPAVEDPEGLAKRLLGVNGISQLMREFGQALTQMSAGADHRILFEVAVVNCIFSLKKFDKQLQARKAS